MKKKVPDFEYEIPHFENGFTVIGIDEVGRGCLAGPITVGAVAFSIEHHNDLLKMGINDSKCLSESKRAELSKQIKSISKIHATASSDVQIINSKGIIHALKDSIAQVVEKCILHCPDDKIILLIDGAAIDNIPYRGSIKSQCIINGDALSISIAAASIIAKVERDEYMTRLSTQHADYKWDKNKGYGTADHRSAIIEHGLTAHHRTLFVRNVLQKTH